MTEKTIEDKNEDKKIKILIAEDDKFLVKVLRNKFIRKGFDVIISGNGNETIDKIKFAKPDLVLLDLIMPYKNGFDVLEEVKMDKKCKDIPVIILSNLGQKSDIERGKKLGVVDYLIKSNLSINDVISKVNEVLVSRKIVK